jgi:hypothetical protein
MNSICGTEPFLSFSNALANTGKCAGMLCNGDAKDFIQCFTAHEGQKKTWGVSSIGKILGSLARNTPC